MSENLMESMMMQSDDGEFDISSIAMYKPFEGLMELRVVSVDSHRVITCIAFCS